MSDPRASLTSASNALGDKLCPGRHIAQRGLPEAPSAESEAGTLVHEAFRGAVKTEALSSFQRKTFNRAKEIEQVIVCNWLNLHGVDAAQHEKRAHRELRLWARIRGQAAHSGQIDALWLAGDMKHALVEDLKSLFGDVEEPEVNEQLRDYAALVWENYGCETVTVFVNQPNVNWGFGDQTTVTYEEQDLKRAHKEMLARVKRSNNPNSKRIPGVDQCKFCRACGTDRCPESQQLAVQNSLGLKPLLDTGTPKERGEIVETLKTAQKTVEKMLGDIKDRIAKDPSFATGWGIGKEQDVRAIDDVISTGAVLKEAFGDVLPSSELADKLAACCTLRIGKLEDLHETLSGLNGKEASDQFKMLFGHLVNTNKRAGSLVKVKTPEPTPEPEDDIPF